MVKLKLRVFCDISRAEHGGFDMGWEAHFFQFSHHVAHFLLLGRVDQRRKRGECLLHDSLVCYWEVGQLRQESVICSRAWSVSE